MQQRTYPSAAKAPGAAPRQKRYGWWRCYNDFVGHPKWRLVAARAGVHLAFATVIVQALCQIASKSRKRGFIGDAEFDIIAVMTDIPAEQVADVFRTLCEIGWIEEDHITDWPDRQPEIEDPTNAERQRRYRAKKRAETRNTQMGIKEIIEIAGAGRFIPARATATPAPPVVVAAFDGDAEVAAKEWLFGDGGAGYGMAANVIAQHYNINRLNADAKIRGWLRKAEDAVALAKIISGAREHTLNDDRFRNVVDGQVADLVRMQTSGGTLPLGMAAVSGGRA